MLARGSVRHRGPTSCGNYLSEVRLQSLAGATVMERDDHTPEEHPDAAAAEQPVPEVDEKAQQFIRRFFQPAASAQECSVMLTTDQLFDRINAHSPGEVPKHLLVATLRSLGFVEQYIGQEFKWLMNVATAA